ncbi:Phosphotransferase enzyme family protein [Thermomonospora echinospora]|uniref:Phosphotransferase enzyme family protein n=1 Tax=Thermomonospora echinospora TaxID=1992 RepID=A0A1H5T2D4_9ACTN|nr:phosphotransferase [Thermomonospora echinospora]SEF56973.1 Phosphotransferase enzyme family protein [Thermomonospora echinospora]
MNAHVVEDPSGLTPEWLSAALGAEVTAVSWERVGSGQIGACYRLTLEGGQGVPRRLVAKLAAEDPAARAFLGPAYRAEVSFYRDLAATVAARTPRCHYSALADDHTTFVLLLEDLSPAVQGDQIAGCTPGQAAGAVANLAGLHGPRWCDPTLLDLPWLSAVGEEDATTLGEVFGPAVDTFVERFADRLPAADVRTLRQVADRVAAWVVGRPERFGLVHGDYRLDNLLFAAPPEEGVTAVDWQTLSIGHPLRDLAFFLATGLRPEDRPVHERTLVETYHTALTRYGVDDYDLGECLEDYRFAAVQGPLITVLGCVYGTRTERGDTMFLTMTTRSCAAIRELGTLDLI